MSTYYRPFKQLTLYSSFNNLRHTKRLILALVVVATIYLMHSPQLLNLKWKKLTAKVKCPIVELDPYAPEMSQFLHHLPLVNCLDRKIRTEAEFLGAAFRLERGHYLVQQSDLTGKECCYRKVTSDGIHDVTVEWKCTTISEKTTQIPPDYEVVDVVCWPKTDENKVYYRDGFGPVSLKPEVEKRIAGFENKMGKPSDLTEDEENLSVIVIGLDTMSQMHFIRSMPKTQKYLTEVLSAVRLDGYNKIAENTLPNVFASMTGRSYTELVDECLDKEVGIFSSRLDRCEFIWKIFAEKGYRTGHSEDDVKFSIFNPFFTFAFESGPPTDYYWKPYQLFMENHLGHNSSYCYGPQLSFEVMLENVKNMAHVFKNKRHFNFAYSIKLGHENFNALAWSDEPLYETVKYLHVNGHLNHTALIIIGDHGLRGHDIVVQAMQENRRPAAYIALPDWFQRKYSQAYLNLRENAESVITTPFDLYSTMLDFMYLGRFIGDRFHPNPLFVPATKEMKTRAISLFDKIPKSRSCGSAGIPWLWCTCNKRTPISPNSSLAIKAGEMTVAKMNSMVEHNNECATLTFHSIKSADMLELSEDDSSKECDNPDKCINRKKEKVILQIVGRAQPGDVEFETLFVKDMEGEFHLPAEIVRVDWFQWKSQCVERYLQTFCICKSYAQ